MIGSGLVGDFVPVIIPLVKPGLNPYTHITLVWSTCQDLKVHHSHQYVSFKTKSMDLNFFQEMYLTLCLCLCVWFCREVWNWEMHHQEDAHCKSALYQRLNHHKKSESFYPNQELITLVQFLCSTILFFRKVFSLLTRS